MFASISQEVYRDAAFLRARVNTSSGAQSEHTFVRGKICAAAKMVMKIVPKQELKAAPLAARLKRDICKFSQ